jgi:hypothetical protein
MDFNACKVCRGRNIQSKEVYRLSGWNLFVVKCHDCHAPCVTIRVDEWAPVEYVWDMLKQAWNAENPGDDPC